MMIVDGELKFNAVDKLCECVRRVQDVDGQTGEEGGKAPL
jgi:hypothetical protein